MQRYDLVLFHKLQAEYGAKRAEAAKQAPSYSTAAVAERGHRRAGDLVSNKWQIDPSELTGKRVLDIGCGNGEVIKSLNERWGCEGLGLDIKEYSRWENPPEGVEFRALDISAADPAELGEFDFVVSYTVWEHIMHPRAALDVTFRVMKPGAKFYMSANLYRGTSASHRTRDIHFSWPHLLFSDEVIADYFTSIGRDGMGASWVNKLTAAEYVEYFDEIGFETEKVWYQTNPFDEDLYKRFEDKLGRYPRRDLERNFLHAVLVKPATPQ